MNTKNITIGVLVALVLVTGFIAFKAPTVISVPSILTLDASTLGSQQSPVVNVEASQPIVIPAPIVNVNVPKQTSTVLGSVASPDIMSKWFSFGGVRQWAGKLEALATASSTVCAIQGPAATSTLGHGSVRFTLASTSAISVDLAKGTTQYATTTKIGSTYGIAASAQATIVASSTGSVAGNGTIFAPNDWFVVRFNEYSNSSGAGNAPTGVCEAQWTII